MTILRYLFGSLWFLLVWLMVAVLVGFVLMVVWPKQSSGPAGVGIGLDWRSFPGTFLGFLAARQSWRVHVRRPAQK